MLSHEPFHCRFCRLPNKERDVCDVFSLFALFNVVCFDGYWDFLDVSTKFMRWLVERIYGYNTY